MQTVMNRRTVLAAGATGAAGLALTGCSGSGMPESNAGTATQTARWNPGPAPGLTPDPTPGTTPVRLACKSNGTNLRYPRRESIYEIVQSVREQGYTSTSFTSLATPRSPWLNAPDSLVRETRAALDELDVELFDIMVWTNLIHPDLSQRQQNLKYVAETIECADRLGCRMVTMITGSCGTEHFTQWHPDNWSDETWDTTVGALRQLIGDTPGCETALGMEACVMTNINDPFANRKIVDDVGDPRCRVCLDPTNMSTLHNYYHSTELLNECFDRMGELIIGCHAKDQFLEQQMYVQLVEVPPGRGVQDYATYLARMSRLSWPRTLMLEHFADEDYPPAKAFIEDTAKRIGVTIYS